MRAFLSVINQSYRDIEIIVVNDSPHSKFCHTIRKIVREYKAKKKLDTYYFENPTNRGSNYSRNRGIKYSHGDILAFLDDDDEWLPNKLESMIYEFQDYKVGIVYSDFYRQNQFGEREIIFKAHRRGWVLPELLSHNIIGPTSGPLIRKECIDKCGMFDISIPARQDYDLWIRIVQRYRVAHVRKPLFIYHISDPSISSSIIRRIRGRYYIIWKYRILYRIYADAYKYTLMEYYSEMLYNKCILFSLIVLLHMFISATPSKKEIIELIKNYCFMIIRKPIMLEEVY